MKAPITYWLEWDWEPQKRKILARVNGSRNHQLPDYSWSDIGEQYITVFCDSNTFGKISQVAENEGIDIKTDQKKWTHEIGRTRFKLLRGGTEEEREGRGTQAIKKLFELIPNFTENHPRTGKDFWQIGNHWSFAPRFENLQLGTFENVWKIDIKACYANIIRDYPLPCGEPEFVDNPELIEEKLKEGKKGFLAFLLKSSAEIKKDQIPFVPNYHGEIKEKTKGRFFLSTELFNKFKKHYKIRGKVYYKNFWIFEEKKGCVNKFLNYCEELKKTDERKGKDLPNVLNGYFGKSTFSGYHYYPFHLAVIHLAILKTYYLCREFKKENVLAIRVDCIYVKGELPESILKEKDKYHIEKGSKVGFAGEELVYDFDKNKLLARNARGEEREKLINWFLE